MSPGSSGKGSGVEDSEDAEGTAEEGAGEGHGGVETADNRAETMGVSLGPVAQGHIVGVRYQRCVLCQYGSRNIAISCVAFFYL